MELPIPPSVNSIWKVVRPRSKSRKVGLALSDTYSVWRDEAIIALRQNMPRIKPAEYPVAVTVEVCRGKGWTKGRDLDNAIKAVLDALVKANRIVDDNEDYVVDVHLFFGEYREKACAFVSVEPIKQIQVA